MKVPHETKLSGTEEIPPLDASTRPVRLESSAAAGLVIMLMQIF